MTKFIDTTSNSNRIIIVDALRGFGLLGILFLHSIEHFQLTSIGTELIGPFSAETDEAVKKSISFLFQSKAYVIFSLMFGLSFWIQYQHSSTKSANFSSRFLWRMVILFGFGVIHSLFYSADFLVMYALLSLILIFSRKWSDRALMIAAAFFLIQPFYVVRFIINIFQPDVNLFFNESGGFWKPLYPLMEQDSLRELIQGNLQIGWKAMATWSWEHGRIEQTTGLFLLGVLAARKRIFTEASFKFWLLVLIISLVLFLPLNAAREHIKEWVSDTGTFRRQLKLMLDAYRYLAQALVWISIFCMLWRVKFVNKVLQSLAPLGKMSLSNYILMNVVGVLVFQGVGFGLYRYFGSTMSLFYAVIALSFHLLFSNYWLKHFKYGPLEYVWRKLTWMFKRDS